MAGTTEGPTAEPLKREAGPEPGQGTPGPAGTPREK